MHILIAPDSFKECLTASEVAQAIQTGFQKSLPDATFDLMPIGDGGEGTLAAMTLHMEMMDKTRSVTGPFGEITQMTYAQKGKLALFEMADLVGLAKIPVQKRNPLVIQTRGLGELVVELAKDGLEEILIGVGGSASHDGGIGMAAGLGYEFFDKDGMLLEPVGKNLSLVKRVSDKKVPSILKSIKVSILTDVTNPLCGKEGATYVFAGQKGLERAEFEEVDRAMNSFYKQVNSSMIAQKGAGAGGGMAAGLQIFLGGQLLSGIDFLLDRLDFDRRVQDADLVIVGEGKMDAQSLSGKAPIALARRVPQEIPVLAICGSVQDDLLVCSSSPIKALFPILAQVDREELSPQRAKMNLIRTAQHIGNLLKLSMPI